MTTILASRASATMFQTTSSGLLTCPPRKARKTTIGASDPGKNIEILPVKSHDPRDQSAVIEPRQRDLNGNPNDMDDRQDAERQTGNELVRAKIK